MGDIGKRAAVDKGGVVFQGLHQIGLERFAQQHCHRAVGIEVAGADWLLLAGVADHDIAQALFQVLHARGQAEDGHDFGGHHNVKTVLARVAVAGAAQRDGDVPQRAVVHVHDALPGDAAHVDSQGIAVVDVVIDQRGQQIVSQADGVEIAGEVQIDVFHGHDLGHTAAGRAALHAEHRAQAGLAQANNGFFADAVERDVLGFDVPGDKSRIPRLFVSTVTTSKRKKTETLLIP